MPNQEEQINILHLTNTLAVGGAEVLLLQYIKALGSKRYRHMVYFLYHDGPLRHQLENLGVMVHQGPAIASVKNPLRFIGSFAKLLKNILTVIEQNKPQIIQSHLGQANQLAVLVGKIVRLPVLTTVHNTMAFSDPRSTWDPRVFLNKLINLFTYRFSTRVIAISDEVRQIIQAKFRLPDAKIIVVKNGILFNKEEIPSIALEQEFPDTTGRLKIMAIGALTYQKSFETLILAARHLLDQGQKNFSILIAGEGVERPKLEKMIKDLHVGNHVRLLGLRHDVLPLLQAADVFAMPSRFEGLSIAMIEAMASGLPVVAANAPGLRDYVKDENNGLLFPIEDHAALGSCLTRLTKDNALRKRLSLGAQHSFKEEFDLAHNISPLEEAFNGLSAPHVS